jgi:plastocyanin
MKSLVAGVFLCLVAGVSAAELTCAFKSTKDEAVGDVVASLIPLDAPAPAVAADAQVEVAQKNQEFQPYVTVIQTGTRVVLPNEDTVQHHVYSLSKPKKFELSLYNPGKAESEVFDVAGLVTLGCNIHDWMISHIVVVPTPWFGKSDTTGTVRLTAPAGRYRLEIWHPRLGTPLTKEITLREESAAREDFALTLKADRRVRRPNATKSGGY